MSLDTLDRYLPAAIRTEIEQRYWAPINAQARLEQAVHSPTFMQDTNTDAPFFSDHGVVHARDVAGQVLQVLEASHGVLLPRRDRSRFEFMRGYGVLLAYVHDIGLTDFSRFGRAMHPEVAAQLVLGPGFDDIVQAIWDENCGNLAWRLTRLAAAGALAQPGPLVLRELLAMACCHSKSKVPAAMLADRVGLRRTMQEKVSTDLHVQHERQRAARLGLVAAPAPEPGSSGPAASASACPGGPDQRAERGLALAAGHPLTRFYEHFEQEAFAWLMSDQPALAELVEDAVDTLRTLRCADALRQRGTVLKTSAGYEIFIDRRTANAICALRLGQDHLYLLELGKQIAAGEANIASSELGADGNLRIAFQRGAFQDQPTILQAAYNAAVIVNDIQADVIESFERPASAATPALAGLKPAADMAILLEGVDDNPDFADLVYQALLEVKPQAAARVRCVPSLQSAAARELARYLNAGELDWDLAQRQATLSSIERTGHKAGRIDPQTGFYDVRLIRLKAGEVLIEAGTPSGFVYIPLGKGLTISPLGGYATFPVEPWMPLGVTGVIRGASRNATITAQAEVSLLAIPQEVYLRAWHYTYSPEELRRLLQSGITQKVAET